jgi:hypothetical protein
MRSDRLGGCSVSAVELDCCGRGGTWLVGMTSLLAVLESMCRFVVRIAKIRLVSIDRELVPRAQEVSAQHRKCDVIAPGK